MKPRKPRHGDVAVERSDDELRALVRAYVDQDDQAFSAVAEMRAAPDQCWRFLEIARATELTDEQLAYVSAGLFEDLMGRHGAKFIDKVEKAARQDAKMRILVGTVWRGDMSDVVWRRIVELRECLGIGPL